MKSWITFIFFGLVCFSLPVQGQVSLHVALIPPKFQAGQKFPLQELKSMTGVKYSLNKVKDKAVLMNFWNIGCKGCELEREALNKFYLENKQEPIEFWSVTMNSGHQLTKYLLSHPILWDIKDGVDFMGLEQDTSIQITCMPTSILIGREGIIKYTECNQINLKPGSEFIKLFNQAIKR